MRLPHCLQLTALLPRRCYRCSLLLYSYVYVTSPLPRVVSDLVSVGWVRPSQPTPVLVSFMPRHLRPTRGLLSCFIHAEAFASHARSTFLFNECRGVCVPREAHPVHVCLPDCTHRAFCRRAAVVTLCPLVGRTPRPWGEQQTSTRSRNDNVTQLGQSIDLHFLIIGII